MATWNLTACPLVLVAAIPLMLAFGCSSPRTLEATTPVIQQFQALSASSQLTESQQLFAQKPSAAPTSKTTERVYLAERRVSFVPPVGFTAMTPEEIAIKFPNRGGTPPQQVYANERRSVAVAITFSSARVLPKQLPELKNFLPKFLERAMPQIKWIAQDYVAINDVRWIHLEFISRAIDIDIHNDTYFTSFDGKMLGFNFNSTIQRYDAVSAELRKSRNSIKITK